MISLIKVSDSGPLGSLVGFKGVARFEASGSDKQPLPNHAILSKNSEYDQEIPQSQTADNPVASRGRAAQPSRDTKKTNKAKQSALSSPSKWLQY